MYLHKRLHCMCVKQNQWEISTLLLDILLKTQGSTPKIFNAATSNMNDVLQTKIQS